MQYLKDLYIVNSLRLSKDMRCKVSKWPGSKYARERYKMFGLRFDAPTMKSAVYIELVGEGC